MEVVNSVNLPINLSSQQVLEFCNRWSIVELALFGSVLRSDFRSDSDIDVLVTFLPTVQWSLLDFVRMQQELEEIFNRPVDIVERDTIHNPYRKQRIMMENQVIYAVG
jgi:hypothetical protein